MKKSIAGIIAAVVLLALLITSIVIGVSVDSNAPEPFTAEFTETVIVVNGEAKTKQVEKEFTIGKSGKYILNAEWKPDKDGMLTGCTITDENGKMFFASTADGCNMESAPLKMEEGTYTLTLHFLTSKEQWYVFLIEAEKELGAFELTDIEYDFATDGEFTIPFNIVIEKQSFAYMLGFMVGVGIVLVVSVVVVFILMKVTKKDGTIKCKYDERQDLIRGRGFKYAFFTLLIYNMIVPMLKIFDVELLADSAALFMIGAIAGMLVYVIYAIWNEAYFSLNENPKAIMIAFAFIGLINLALGIVRMFDGTFLTEGKLTFNSINFLLGIGFVIIFMTLAAKQIRNKREEE